MSRSIGVGTLIEVPTERGLAYAQYTHMHPDMGHLLRVLPGFCPERPRDLQEIAGQRELYFTFYPLEECLRHDLVRAVGTFPLPPSARTFPTFRDPRGMGIRQTGPLWLWDGARLWREEHPTDEMRMLPIREIPNHRLFLRRIERDWTPARAAEMEDRARRERSTSRRAAAEERVKHFVYFDDRAMAERFSAAVRTEDRQTAVEQARAGRWRVTIVQPTSAGPLAGKSDLERQAQAFGGSYDGWEGATSRAKNTIERHH